MTSNSHIPLEGSERVAAPGATAIGPADGNEWLEVTVKVKRKAELPEPGDRTQPMLTREALGARYGADPAALDDAAATLAGYGLQILDKDPKTRSIKLAGTVQAMEQAFRVKLMHYKHARGNFRGRLGPVNVPAALGGIVEAVLGLDDRPVAKRREGRIRPVSLSLAASSARPWFFPGELAAIYNFPAGGDGGGQVIGLIEFGGGYFADDLAKFCAAAKITAPPEIVPISVNHMPTAQRDGAEGEVMLDIEVVAGICPNATIPVYFSQFTTKGWVDVLDAAVHDDAHRPQILSISWGDAEDHASWTRAAIRQVNETLKEAALLGVTVCVASGDDGTDDQVGDGHAHVDFPASSPYVLAVGGTSLSQIEGQRREVAWKDGDGLRRDGGGSTGGGVSAVFARPAWQNVPVVSVNPHARPGRVVPDVAADASANTGYFVVVDGHAGVSGGTSASAPLWAALVARINASGKHAGYLTPLLYKPLQGGQTVGAAACNDITACDNATAAVGGYRAQAGYDAVTGWGTPDGEKLLTLI
jgi:kumamolisin